MSDKRMPSEERRRQIMAVAAKLFAEQGYHETTTRQITEACGINDSLLYQHFRSKEDLFIQTMSDLHTKMVNKWWDIAGYSESGLEALRNIHRERIEDSYASADHRISPYHTELESIADGLAAHYAETFREIDEHLEKLVRSGIEDGSIKPDVDPEQVVLTVRAITWFLHLPALFRLNKYLPLEKAMAHLDAYLDSISTDGHVTEDRERNNRRAVRESAATDEQ
jgi:AcrR family transcriptional regulator